MDFLPGLKTNIGLVVAIISLVLGTHATSDQIAEIVSNVGQIIGAVLAVYGLIMKIYRSYKLI